MDSEQARQIDELLARASNIMEPIMYQRQVVALRYDLLDFKLFDWLADYRKFKQATRAAKP